MIQELGGLIQGVVKGVISGGISGVFDGFGDGLRSAVDRLKGKDKEGEDEHGQDCRDCNAMPDLNMAIGGWMQ